MNDPVSVDTCVGESLRAARLSRGLRQDDLAAHLGVDRSTIARYEGGTRSMTVSTLIQVAQVLQRPVTAFIPGIYAEPGLHTVVQVLERHPELLPRVVDLLKVSLEDGREDDTGILPDQMLPIF
ncbi:MAG: XRE family transcriptional regulator [Chloroflexia bacterium]|nr:XRE family transcriptional regulator [Chloroflexia bacterium]